jgi:hypothetical protein
VRFFAWGLPQLHPVKPHPDDVVPAQLLVPVSIVALDYLSADGRGERFPALAAECLRLKADIIAVSTTPAAQAAKTATHSIPSRGVSHGRVVGQLLNRRLSRNK